MTAPANRSISPQKKSTLLAQVIVGEMVDEGLSPGDRLPAESEMVRQYGVGRSTIREALRLLETQGVLSIRTGPGGGPVVSELDARFTASNLALLMQMSGATFRDVIDARVFIEPDIAAAAADRASPHFAAELRACLDLHRNQLDDHDRLVSEAARFHDLVAASSANPLVEFLLRALHLITLPFADQVNYEPARRKGLLEAHVAIVEAIESGDPAAAADAMRADLQDFIDHVEVTKPSLWSEPVRWSSVGL